MLLRSFPIADIRSLLRKFGDWMATVWNKMTIQQGRHVLFMFVDSHFQDACFCQNKCTTVVSG